MSYKRQYAHVSRFLGLRCAPDILVAQLFPNGKEVSESMATLEAVRKHVLDDDLSERSEGVALISVGDGKTPRTAALFAFMTAWDCFSIDPLLAPIDGTNEFHGISVDRLSVIGKKAQDVKIDCFAYGRVVIVGVHSHASVDEMLSCVTNTRRLDCVFMPCCVSQYGIGEDVIEYDDEGIWSPH